MRIVVISLLLLTGTLAVVFVGGTVSMCLGPLGVTVVECARATGVLPRDGVGPAIFAACVGLAGVLVVAPRLDRSVMVRLVGAWLIGMGVGITWRWLTWPPYLVGGSSTGEIISLPWPVDPMAVLATGAIAASIEAFAVAVWLRLRFRPT